MINAKSATTPRKTKKKTADVPATEAEAPAELTPDWQHDFLGRLRLENARIPARFQTKTFENFKVKARGDRDRKQVLQVARDYVKTFKFNGEPVVGLILTGAIGCGKTHIAVAMLKAIIKKDYTGLYYNMPDLLSDIRATFADNSPLSESELLDEIQAPDLLVLDDLGAETSKGWVNDRLYLIVNRRYESNRPVLVTTNLDLGELTNKLGERTVSRLCEMCQTFAPFPEEDYRKQNMH